MKISFVRSCYRYCLRFGRFCFWRALSWRVVAPARAAFARFVAVFCVVCVGSCACKIALPLFAQEKEQAGGAGLQSARSITGTRELEKGDKGFIAWRFQGFQSVRVVGDGMSAIRGARDMITILPSRTTDYKITALAQGGVRFDAIWRVVVLNADEADSLEKEENRLASLSTM
jgi:hypothetical protein